MNRSPLSLLVAAFGGVALATIFSLGTMLRTLEDMTLSGGGMGAFAYGVWQAARLPLAASWIAAAAMLVALILAMRSARDVQPEAPAKRTWSIGVLAIVAGVVPVLAFARAMAFIVDVVRPGHQPAWITSRADVVRAVYASIMGVGTASAISLFIALMLVAQIRRRGTAPRRVVLAVLVAGLVASAALIAGQQIYTTRWQGITTGRQPIESRISSSVERRQVYIGVSRTVNFDDSVSRSSCTRSRNSSAVSDSNATTKS